MNKQELAQKVVNKMYTNDAFSQWLGIEVLEVIPGGCTLKMKVREEMTNGFKVAHGGVTCSFADSALAFACNGHGQHAVSVEISISHILPVFAGDELIAVAKEISKGHKIANYVIEVTNQKGERVAWFKGLVYRKSEEWEVE